MRPRVNHDPRRGKLVQMLFWGGIGLAPLAVLVVLFGASTGALRVAVAFAVLTIVALALSIALRPTVEMVRVDIEHRFLDEVERVRAHSREEVSAAARNTHRALSEQIRVLNETIEWLREQLDEMQAAAVLAQPAVAAPGVQHTETVHVTRRTTTVGRPEERGTVYGSPAAIAERRDRSGRDEERVDDWRREDERAARRDDERASRHVDDRAARRDDDRAVRRDDRAVRRDDDRARRDDDRSRRDDEWASHRDDGRSARHHDDAGARRGDDGAARRGQDEHRYDDRGPARDEGRHHHGEGRDGSWEASGDRWASVRSDDRGRELRIGERRSSVRSDERGTEYRVEDRWAALRREDDPSYGESDWESTFRSLSSGGARPMPALPSAPRGETAASYLDESREFVPPSRGRVREAERDRSSDRGGGDDHGERGYGERGYDDRGYDDRGYADRGDRGHSDRGRDHDRYDGPDRGRERDYGRDDSRDYDRERDIPRQRGGYDDYR